MSVPHTTFDEGTGIMEGEMSTAITHFEGTGVLAQWRDPEEVLAQAQKAAIALKKVLDLKANKVIFNNEIYLEREDWGTVGQFFGCGAKTLETRYVEYGGVHGWEAVAIVFDRSMNEIGRAESMCLDDEPNWGDVPVYEWKDKLDADGKKIWNPNLRKGKGGYEAEKIQSGTSKKPMFQLRSMAATRAEAKALKGVFSWVVVLAGYKPTPAEELTGHEDFGDPRPPKPPVTQPTRASDKNKQQEVTGTPANQQGSEQAASNPSEKEISGIIEKAQVAKSGSMWITVKGEPLVVAVDEKNIDSDMVAGNFIKFRGLLKKTDKFKSDPNPEGKFWSLLGLIELSKVQEGEVTQSDDGKLAPDASAVAAEMFGDKPAAGKEAVQGMIDKGQLTAASNLPATTKPGTIGKKRAQRLYAIAHQNLKTNGGLTEEKIRAVLAAFYPDGRAEYHLSDLEIGKYEEFEKFCTGEDRDWPELLG
jgi:hypothetical protein